jgi:hypothetical protein
MTDTTILPPSASESGKNAYYLGGCKIVGQAPAYCACLDRLKNLAKHSDCDRAVRDHACQAKNMRAEELLQGKALYFIPRGAPSLGKSPAWSVEPPAKTGTPTTGTIDTGGYADAINAALSPVPATMAVTTLAMSPAKTIATTTYLNQPPINPGESPIAYARRCVAHQQTNQEKTNE